MFYTGDDDSLANMPMCYEGFAQGGANLVGPEGNQVRVDYTLIPNVHTWRWNEFDRNLHQFFVDQGLQSLGIYGASDGFGNEDEEMPPGRPCWYLNTRCAIVLQPFAWNRTRLIEDSQTNFKQQILRGSLASYITEVPDLLGQVPPYQRNERHVPRVFDGYVKANAGALSASVQQTVTAVLSKAACGGCHLMPIYGLHANYPGTWTLNTLVRTIVMLKGVLGVVDGPVVLFNIRGGYDTDGESNLSCTQILADHAQSAIQITQANDGIFVVRSPGLPTALFHQMAANATLPMLLEGANTANLCLQLGTPFLGVSDNASIPTLDVQGAKGHDALRSLTRFLWGERRATDEQVYEVACAMVDIMDSAGTLRRYFRRLHEMVRAPEGNQLAFALSELGRRIAQRGPPLPALPQPPPQPPQPLVLRLRLRPPESQQAPPVPKVFTCPRCKKFARMGPGTCWKCGVALEPG